MNRALIYRQGKPTELPGFPPAAPHRRSTGHMGPLSADAGHPASQHFSLTFIKRGTGNRNTQVYFQTQPYLGATMLGFLISSEMTGRLLGGLLQYKKEVPVNKRYPFTKAVYLIYSLADMALLFLPYPAMLANRFFCGSLGICSATIRESAVQSYLPEQMREVIYIKMSSELTFREIGEILGKSENWARVTYFRGKEKIMKGLMKNE